MSAYSEKEIECLRKAGRIVATTLWEMINMIKPGVSTLELDQVAGKVLAQHGARSAPALLHNFPGHTCISVNHIIAHGRPDKRKLRCGDIINIDVSAEIDGFFSDVGYTTTIGNANEELVELCQCSKNALLKGISVCKPGEPIASIGKIIEKEARENGYTIIKNLCSHGVGKSLHVSPVNIFNYDEPSQEGILEEGMVIALEPYLSTGACRAIELEDGWTMTTHNHSFVAQFEHTLLITSNQPEILTRL
ncbi:MAG: type I methionyl aminopeptidase [Cyclobacteriaceae bacterium]